MNDSLKPIGHVIITDKNTGKILVDKDNMILKDGRRFLAVMFGINAFIDSTDLQINLVDNNQDNNKDYIWYSKCKLNSIILRQDYSTPEYDKVDIAQNAINGSEKGSRIIRFKEDNINGNVSLEISEDNYPYLKIDVDYADSQALDSYDMTQLSSIVLGLVNTDDTTQYTTFSHICFDPITIIDDTALNIKYYIYF